MKYAGLCAHDASVARGERVTLSGFTFCVRPGEFVAIAGANGAGKSTALKLLAGILPPTSGGVELEGTPLHAFEPAKLGQQIAYLPQERTIHWGISARRVVELGRLPHKSFSAGMSAKDEDAIRNAMERMDVLHLQHRSVAELSGGERARVLLARALAQEALYVIADEPAAGLDPAHALTLFEDLRDLSQDGKAVVTALHDIAFAARFATRILLFKDGKCIVDGRCDEVLSSANLAEAFNIDAAVTHIDGLPVFLPRSSLRRSAEKT